jgi:LAO/AO transport system kinase
VQQPSGPAGTDPVGQLARSIGNGDRAALARSITLVESTRDDHRRRAEALIDELLPRTGRSLRLGVTGSPGVGKSTFIDGLGSAIVERGHRLAVLAVDPSSTTGGGAILGDKTRMAELSARPEVFIRPSPSGGTLGGIGRRTRDAILLCEAAGFDVIIVETVGVGQSETTVATVTDLFLLLVGPGGGDDLQGIKRGIMELADLVVVNKADGQLAVPAEQTAGHYRTALHLVRPKHEGITTPVLTCSALQRTGLDEVWRTATDLTAELGRAGVIERLRSRQALDQLGSEIRDGLVARATADPAFAEARREVEHLVAHGALSVSGAARRLTDLVFS